MNSVFLATTQFLALFIFSLALSACGPQGSADGTKPADGCLPIAVADTGGDVYFTPDPVQSKISRLGTPGLPGMDYEWSPKEGLSDSRVPQPYVKAPEDRVVYTLRVTSRCNTAVANARVVMLKEFKGPIQKVRAQDNKGVFHDYPTGYNPGFLEHYRGQHLHMPKGGIFKKQAHKAFPEEFNQTPPNFHVNRQPNGSCWAEGARSAAEAALFYVAGKQIHISTQRIIDCSGFGSAASGGQISIDDFLAPKGVVYEADYPYTGRDGRCNKSAPFREQSKQNYFIRSASGGSPEWDDMKNAFMEYGAGEICGSASSLRNGGWVSNPGNGGTNHCYSANGWLKGELHGQEAGEYIIVQNSWGADWGTKGQGYYKIAPDGKKIRSSVMTENKFPSFGSPCPPPVVDPGKDKTITLLDGRPNSVYIGTPALPGQSYLWSPEYDSANKILSDARIAEPIASPSRTTKYKIVARREATAQCPALEASSEMTVHVYRETGNLLMEIF